ncbi:LOW QUALITY PROTEIN: polycystic kidney disease protein 1-like 3 [Podarcis raffonei]|uniref:LOW QUALITY PROTEIN: polycystic kidney disease protein 1-like 3 n=1 Tax=Podarcis raffonei TaxID=65483 RepID=UPI00232921D7|nr:LOW QUALITY PROTEIN: polycystic kidney disease protein 1-like 3 [Podarcis raffonei]
MGLPIGMWLWLWAAQVSSEKSEPACLPVAGEDCYRLLRWPQPALGAVILCGRSHGRLLHTWNQQIQDALRDRLDDRSKTWIGAAAKALPEVSHPGKGESGAGAQRPNSSTAEEGQQQPIPVYSPGMCVIPHSASLTRPDAKPLRRTTCQHLTCGPTEATPILTEEPTATAPLSAQPSAATPPPPSAPPGSSTVRQPTTADIQSFLGTRPELGTPRHPPSSPKSASSTWPASNSSQTHPNSQTSAPEPSTQPLPTSKTTSGSTKSHKSNTSPDSFTFSPRDFPPEDQGKALEKVLHQFNQAVQTPDHPMALEQAARMLENLTNFHALLSDDAQASASQALLSLSSQLLRDHPASNASCLDLASQALFQALSNLLQASGSQTPSFGPQQEPKVLETALEALPLIQTGLLLGSSTMEESTVTVVSPVLSTTLSRCDKASLSHASFHLLQPRGLNVTFPSSSALEPVLSQHPQVQVQVASFAFNPFQHLDGKPIKRMASIALMASEESIGVHNLAEEIEIGLSAEASAEAPHTHLTGNVRNFDIVVNITSVEDALLVLVESSTVVQITLHLGLQPEPNKNSSLLNTTLPSSGWQEEGTYTWVIPPEELQHHGPGNYYISAEVAPLSQGPWNLSIHTIISGCYYWSSQHQAWRSDGCRVGSQSTLHSTQCLCNHLTFFGCVALVLPHLIDLHNTAKLLSTVGQNPSGLALLSSLLLGYGAALVWTRWKQRTDVKKVKVTILADNEATACFPYLVQVFTGYRRGAGTSAKVILTLYGAEGRSEPHLLQHPQGPSFERGGRDAFLLATQKSLGNLHAIRLWHDNTGPNPSWFVRRLVVCDLPAKKKWHFLCDSWLAADLDDGHVDKVFAAASERDLLSFRYQFWSGLVDKLTQEHLWLSVVTCSPWSPFTRVQRLSCCLALLCCTFLINIMFWRKEAASRSPEAGPFMVTWHELLVSVETAIFLMPVSLLISHIFQLVQPPAPKPPAASSELLQTVMPPKQVMPITQVKQELEETLGFLYKNSLCQCRAMDKFPGTCEQVPELVAALCDLIESHLQHQKDLEGPPQERRFNLHSYLSHVLNDLGTQLCSLDLCSFPNPYDHLHAVDQLRRVQQHLKQQQAQPWPSTEGPGRPTGPRSELSSFPLEDHDKERPPFSHCLPGRFSFACWLTVGSISLVSAFFTVLYSLEMSRDEAGHWAINILLSVLQNIFVMQPLKVLALTFFFSLLHKRELWKDKGQEQQLWWALGLVTARGLQLEAYGRRDWADPAYRPPALQPMVRPKERALKDKKLYSLIREIAVQLVFLAVLMVLSYTERSPNEFYFNNALQKTFTSHLEDILTPEELYGWIRVILLPGLHGDSEGLAMDGNSFLVGSVRLRQIRAPPKPGPAFLPLQEGRQGPMASWGPPAAGGRGQASAWVFQNESTLQEYPIWGKFALYPGSGYLANLGRNKSYAKRTLRYLERNNWLDRSTRVVFIEFVVYNANVNLFCAVTLILEASGMARACSRDKGGLALQWASEAGWLSWGCWGGRWRKGIPSTWEPALLAASVLDLVPVSVTGALFSKSELQILRLYPDLQLVLQFICAQITFLLLILYYIFVQGRQLKQQKWKYFSSKRNLLDASTILISMAAIGLYVKRRVLAEGILKQHRQDRNKFISFYEMVEVDSALTYLIAFLVALTTIKLWNLLRLNPRMYLITQTLQKAWDEVLGFLLTLLVLLVGYAIVCNLMFGWSVDDYKTFFNSAVTIVGLLIGIFNYEEVIAVDPVFGAVLIVTSVISMVFVIINLFVSALLTTFSREMKAAKASKEESMLQLIQLKISTLFGIKKQPPFPGASRKEPQD